MNSSNRRRLVHFLTGIRSEFDILTSVIRNVIDTPGLEAGVVVTGAHLSKEFGESVRQIEADGYPIAGRIDSLLRSDGLSGRVKGIALQLTGLTDLFARQTPDFFVIMGDREETISGAVTALYHHIPVVHIGGGDHADDGNVDNVIRHAVTKLSHLHMAASPRSAERILALGEEPWRVSVTGGSGLDRFLTTPSIPKDELLRRLDVDWGDEPFALFLFHPTILDYAEAKQNAALILKSLEKMGLNVLIVHPNSDPGNRSVVDAINEFVASAPRARAFAYLPRETFVNAMRHATLMIGNSSAGILEAPSLKLPVVNVGPRQTGREHGDNVIFVGYDAPQVEAAIGTCLHSTEFRSKVNRGWNPYGDGTAGKKIAEILASVETGPNLLNKRVAW